MKRRDGVFDRDEAAYTDPPGIVIRVNHVLWGG